MYQSFRLKPISVVIALVIGSQLSGCSVTPSDPRSPYYTQYLNTSTAGRQLASSNIRVDRGSPIRSLDSSVESQLWKHFDRWRGTPYAFGGNSRQGIDCSAYVQLTMQEVANLKLPRTTRTQIHIGQPIELAQLAPGDVVFFQTGANQMHNGVYMGGGQFMHASSSVGVTVSELDNSYWRARYLKSIRVLNS